MPPTDPPSPTRPRTLTGEQRAIAAEPADADLVPLSVRFAGAGASVSRGRIAQHGAHLVNPLPFLRLNSPVTLGPAGGEERRDGILRGVRLDTGAEDGIPRLKIFVAFPHEDDAQMVTSDATFTPLPVPVPAPEGGLPIFRMEDEDMPHRPPNRVRPLVAAIFGISLGAVVALLALRAMAPAPTPAPPPPVVVRPPPPPSSPPPPPVLAEGPAFDEPIVTVEGKRTIVLVPINGPADRMDRYDLLDPPGIALDLAGVKPPAQPRLLQPSKGGVQRIVLRERGTGVRVELHVGPLVSIGKIDHDATRLRIELRTGTGR